MLRIRRFEERAAELYGAGKIRGFLHLCVGEEAVAVGVMRALTEVDAVVSTYREHGHALARGVPADRIMAEMFGKAEGCCRGRGGSMHLFDASHRFYGGNAIVAGGLPLATGLALADKMLGRRAVTVCLFGDGAVAEGEFHECMNLAALWRLPVLFLCENNLYAMGTALALTESQVDLCAKARSYDMPADRVDGMDVTAVERAALAAVATVRAGDGPRFLELATYRFRAHSMFDAELYREKREVESWKLRDPIASLSTLMKLGGALDEAGLSALETEVAAELDAAVAFAEAGTLEPVDDLTRDVYATGASDARQ
ncbi:MAG: pyruvate dehydrogenase (acetyl-transferring) E1 component subunit alpha [Deltaproteobacteria bacterium]|nr:pyruvate dehydrogenase (acetyl-transferring) E1 component subunit alpha [Deltaproteobacteria bacterium]